MRVGISFELRGQGEQKAIVGLPGGPGGAGAHKRLFRDFWTEVETGVGNVTHFLLL